MPHFGGSHITGPAAAQATAAIQADWPAVSLYRWRPIRAGRQLKGAQASETCRLCARPAAPDSAYCPYCARRLATPGTPGTRGGLHDPRRQAPAGNRRVRPQ